MKHLKIAFGLVVAAGLMAVVASPAMALGPRAVTCVKVAAGTGKWTSNKCTTAGIGEWETKEITETEEVTASGTLEQEDSKSPGGATAIICSATGTGTVGFAGAGTVKTIMLRSCEFVKGKAGECEESKPVTSRFLNLPWATRLEERVSNGGEVRTVLTSTISGKAPGLAVECTVAGIFKIADECEGVMSTGLRANRSVGSVEGLYDKVSEEEPGTCSVGGAKSGFLRGVITGELRNQAAGWILAAALKT
jgi:hypothetical protein